MTVTPRRPATGVATRLRGASQTTPGRYRLWSLGTAVVLVVGLAAATTSASRMRSSTHKAQTNTGPVLVATQRHARRRAA